MNESISAGRYIYLPAYSSFHRHYRHAHNQSWPRKRHDPFHAGQLQYDHIFTDSQRRHGAVLIHIAVCIYTFFALAILCEEYFCQSLEKLCRKLRIPPDVAGATFMAAGSSMPTLLISIISVFMGESELGLGTIIGSTLFNILFVTSLCALLTAGAATIKQWSLLRDSTVYVVHLLALLLFISDGVVHWYEAITLLLLYMSYIALIINSKRLEDHFNNLFAKGTKTCQGLPANTGDEHRYKITERDERPPARAMGMADESTEGDKDSCTASLFRPPEGLMRLVGWLALLPIRLIFFVSIPDVRVERWQNWYSLSFCMSITWMALISYILVWAVAIIGETLRIPQAMMGLTLLAAGSSVPDAIASVVVARKGEADMAIANCVGSNIFDITCLAFPWIIATSIICPNSVVTIDSSHMVYTSLTLFGTIVTCVGVIHMNKWRLTKRAGVCYLVAYFVFLIQCSIIEMLPIIVIALSRHADGHQESASGNETSPATTTHRSADNHRRKLTLVLGNNSTPSN